MLEQGQGLAICKHVRGEHVVPGWGCCKCRGYNGYQREKCRSCDHTHCYETESAIGKESLELKEIGGSPILLKKWLERHPGS